MSMGNWQAFQEMELRHLSGHLKIFKERFMQIKNIKVKATLQIFRRQCKKMPLQSQGKRFFEQYNIQKSI